MRVAQTLLRTDDWFQRKDFHEFFESHLQYIAENKIVQKMPVEDNIAAIFKGDFYGLLSYLLIGTDIHYEVLRINGYYSTFDFDGIQTVILIPDSGFIEQLRNIFRTKQKQ